MSAYLRTRARELLILGILTITGCSEISVEEHIAQAREFMQERDVSSAVIALKGALQQEPNNRDARLLLAENYLAVAHGTAAEKELRAIADDSAGDARFHEMYTESILIVGDFRRALEYVDGLDAIDPSPRLTALMAEAHVALGDVEIAQQLLDEVVENSQDPYVDVAHAILELAKDQTTTALDILRKSEAQYPANVRTHIVSARILLGEGEFESAENAFQKAIELVPARADPQVGRVYALLGQRKFEAALKSAKKLTRNFPRRPVPIFLRGAARNALGDAAGAKDDYRQVLTIAPNHPETHIMLARLLLADGELEQAEQLGRAVVKLVPTSKSANALLARILLKNGKPGEAVSMLKSIIQTDDPTKPQLDFVGSVLVEAGFWHVGLKYLERAAAMAPDDDTLKTKVAAAKLRSNNLDGALTDIDSLLSGDELSEKPEILKLLVSLAKKNFDEVIEEGNRKLASFPDNPVLPNLVGRAHLEKQDYEQARSAFMSALEIDERFAPAMISLAHLDAIAGDHESEVTWLERAREFDPHNLRVLLPLARLKNGQGDRDAAIEILDIAGEANPLSLMPYLTLSRIYITTKQFDQAIKYSEKIYQRAPDDARVLLAHGYSLLGIGEPAQALTVLSKAAEVMPESAKIQYALATALHRVGRTEEARTALSKTKELGAEDLETSISRARLEASVGATDSALRIIDELKEKHSKNPLCSVVEGDILADVGRDNEAEIAYERALALGAAGNVALRRYKLQTRTVGREDEAFEAFEQWVANNKGDLYGLYALGVAYQDANRLDKAITAYEEVLDKQPQHLPALNNLAWILIDRDEKRAQSLAEKAYSIAPDDPGINDTLGWILLQQGNANRSRELLQQANEKLPSNPTIKYHLAVARVRNGERAEAGRLLRSALESGAFESRAKAERLLKTLE